MKGLGKYSAADLKEPLQPTVDYFRVRKAEKIRINVRVGFEIFNLGDEAGCPRRFLTKRISGSAENSSQ
jgi:hypothetical protein